VSRIDAMHELSQVADISRVAPRDQIFADGIVNYLPPAGVFLGYEARVAPRDCLVLARQFKSKSKDEASEEFVAAMRITRAGHCAD